MTYTTTQDAATELRELIEDTVEYYCDENMVSGELVYTVLECYSIAKLAQLRGEVD